MGLTNRILPYYTYEDWCHWEGQWELIDGLPFANDSTRDTLHQKITASLSFELTLALKESGCKECKVYDPVDYKISEDTIVQPDVLIICGEVEKKYLDFPPALIAEVLSPSTAMKDRHTKFEIYQSQGVKYYLLVDIDKESIEVYELSGNVYQPKTDELQFILNDGCTIQPDLKAIW